MSWYFCFGTLFYCFFFLFFFFQHKTAYDMRISNWSSVVFSSDLAISCPSAAVSPGRADRGPAWRCRLRNRPRPGTARISPDRVPDSRRACRAGSHYPFRPFGGSVRVPFSPPRVPPPRRRPSSSRSCRAPAFPPPLSPHTRPLYGTLVPVLAAPPPPPAP